MSTSIKRMHLQNLGNKKQNIFEVTFHLRKEIFGVDVETFYFSWTR